MTRSDLKTLAWLFPLALVVCFWWFWGFDTCVKTHLGNRLCEWFPSSPPLAADAPHTPDAVIVENVYCTTSCDAWLNPASDPGVFDAGTFLLIPLLIGVLGAWRLRERSIRRSAIVVALAIFLTMAIGLLIYWPVYVSFGEYGARQHVLAHGLFSAVATLVAMLLTAGIAWLSLRFGRSRA